MTEDQQQPTILVHIPANIDLQSVLGDLNNAGWRDYKIETLLGFSRGYVSQLKCGHIRDPGLQYAARLWNLWVDVMLDAKTVATLSSTGQAL